MDTERTNLVKMGKHIAFLRKKNNMTQQQLADLLDVSNKSISKWENGDVAPDITILRPLSVLLGVDVDELLAGEEITDNSYISLMSKKFSRKRTKKIIFILLISFSILLLILSFIGNHLKWKVIELNNFVDGKYNVHGYIIKNNDQFKIIIDRIDLIDKKLDIYIKEFEISIYSKNKYLLRQIKEDKTECLFQDCINKNNLYYEENNNSKYDLDEIYIVIKYSTDKKNYDIININLK